MCWHCQRQPCLRYYCNLCWFCSSLVGLRLLHRLLSRLCPLLRLCFLYRLHLDGSLCRPSVARLLLHYLSQRTTLMLAYDIGVMRRHTVHNHSISSRKKPCVKSKQGSSNEPRNETRRGEQRYIITACVFQFEIDSHLASILEEEVSLAMDERERGVVILPYLLAGDVILRRLSYLPSLIRTSLCSSPIGDVIQSLSDMIVDKRNGTTNLLC